MLISIKCIKMSKYLYISTIFPIVKNDKLIWLAYAVSVEHKNQSISV